MQFEGNLRHWNEEKGYGFVTPDIGDQDIFVHIKAFTAHPGKLKTGERLRFSVETDSTGRKRAVQALRVRPENPARRPERRQMPLQRKTGSLWLIPAFVSLCAGLLLLWSPPKYFIPFYLIASAVCFAAYAIDKSAALNQSRRTQEQTLHFLGLVGGWPGALLAQQMFRHKTVKREFRTVFWATVILNVMGLIVLSSPFGRDILPVV